MFVLLYKHEICMKTKLKEMQQVQRSPVSCSRDAPDRINRAGLSAVTRDSLKISSPFHAQIMLTGQKTAGKKKQQQQQGGGVRVLFSLSLPLRRTPLSAHLEQARKFLPLHHRDTR